MIGRGSLVIMALWLAMVASPTMAAEAEEMAQVRKVLNRIIPNRQPEILSPSSMPGMYEAVYGSDVMYVSADGRYVVQGDIIDLSSMENLTENVRSKIRLKAMAGLKESDMIVFRPKGETKHTVTIFTDIDCGYCRKLHREVARYTKAGIAIRYLAFPRSGPNTESYFKAVTVWCSDDPRDALTRSKSGEKLARKTCDNQPVDAHMAVAEKVGVSGTPTIVLADGSVIPGYVPADRLAAILAGQ